MISYTIESADSGVQYFVFNLLLLAELLRGPEFNYTLRHKELAIIFGLQKFRTLLLGNRLIIRADHLPLKFLKEWKLLNERLVR